MFKLQTCTNMNFIHLLLCNKLEFQEGNFEIDVIIVRNKAVLQELLTCMFLSLACSVLDDA